MRHWPTHGRREVDEMGQSSIFELGYTQQHWMDPTPLKRAGEPRDLAGAVVYLASGASSFVTGHGLVVDGGYTAH